MKNKLIAVSLMMVAIAISIKVGMVLAEEYATETITAVCKTNGGILMDKNNCPGDALKYKIGSVATEGSGGGVIGDGTGYVRFADGKRVLTEDGKIWQIDVGLNNWVEQKDIYPVDSEIVNSIISWTQNSFITNTDYYIFHYLPETETFEYKKVDFPNRQ